MAALGLVLPGRRAAGRRQPLRSAHWAALLQLLPLYRALSRVAVGDGSRTAFGYNRWLPIGPLALAIPELFPHYTLQCATVRRVVIVGLDALHVLRLSVTATRQRATLSALLAGIILSDAADARTTALWESVRQTQDFLLLQALHARR